ncbi:hypothetical protein FNH22_28885 [Fulvivirga sp. M361]|uniref:hypothetical protein n=1 Tax=Fulvivirga sp. M361 TaxID=2594266 RepID=UPI001179F27E|nr:hypothetical protein [Fulvivirga sp. M361]TRX48612.1 hypothetical protein FNH22_28885 [Fulvivirga sp. M361]
MNKRFIYIPLFLMLAGLILACSENDPISELGESKGKVPFVRLSSVNSLYSAGDTINYSALYWTDRDDVQSLSIILGDQTQLSGTISVDDGAGEVSLTLDTLFVTELALQDDLEHDPLDYRTSLNQYVRSLTFTIPAKYQLWEISETENDAFLKVNELSFSSEIQSLILTRLQQSGVSTTWDDLAGITTAVELKIESTLNLRARVHDQGGNFNESSVSDARIGALIE